MGWRVPEPEPEERQEDQTLTRDLLCGRAAQLVSSSVKAETAKIRETQVVRRAQALRMNHGYIPGGAFRTKRAFFTAKVRARKDHRCLCTA